MRELHSLRPEDVHLSLRFGSRLQEFAKLFQQVILLSLLLTPLSLLCLFKPKTVFKILNNNEERLTPCLIITPYTFFLTSL